MTLMSFLSAVLGDLQGHVMWAGEVPRVEVARCKAAPCGGCPLQGGPVWRLPIARWPHGCVWWAVVAWVSLLPLSTRFCVRTSGVRLLTGEEREREREC